MAYPYQKFHRCSPSPPSLAIIVLTSTNILVPRLVKAISVRFSTNDTFTVTREPV